MEDSIFRDLQVGAFRSGIQPRTAQSAKWFRDRIKDMGEISRRGLLKDPALQRRQRFGIGNLYHFFYDPKHRKTLPFYDSFPLAIMIGPAPGGFYGLNLHYLPIKLRAVLFERLVETTNNKRYDESTKMKVNYQMLKSMSSLKMFKPCFKHYLRTQVESGIVLIEPPEWEIAVFMPTQQFNGASDTKVWANSRKSY